VFLLILRFLAIVSVGYGVLWATVTRTTYGGGYGTNVFYGNATASACSNISGTTCSLTIANGSESYALVAEQGGACPSSVSAGSNSFTQLQCQSTGGSAPYASVWCGAITSSFTSVTANVTSNSGRGIAYLGGTATNGFQGCSNAVSAVVYDSTACTSCTGASLALNGNYLILRIPYGQSTSAITDSTCTYVTGGSTNPAGLSAASACNSVNATDTPTWTQTSHVFIEAAAALPEIVSVSTTAGPNKRKKLLKLDVE
jgi:hypothetical protein